jgi:hypothetical protein
MKYYSTIISFLLLATIIVGISGCGSDDPSTAAEEKQLEKIVGTWQLESASLGATSWNDEFENATLALSGAYEEGGTYDFDFSVTPWPINSPWPEDGNWKFKGTSGSNLTTKIVRLDDGVEMTYTLSDDALTLTFPYSGDGFPDGKVSSVEGNWTFVFSK